MKKFKILIFFFLASTIIISISCSEDILQPESSLIDITSDATTGDGVKISASDLPAAINSYIGTNYAGKSIIKAERYSNQYEIVLSDGTKLEFSLNGAFLEVSKNGGYKDKFDKKVVLPQVILDYIAKNYPNTTIKRAEKSKKKYEVRLSNNVRLEFNMAGVLIKLKA